MSSEKGLLKTCDRCGAQIFLKLTGKQDFDGGYSSRDTFEAEPAGWEYERVAGTHRHLCPACAEEWEKLGRDFMACPAARRAAYGV